MPFNMFNHIFIVELSICKWTRKLLLSRVGLTCLMHHQTQRRILLGSFGSWSGMGLERGIGLRWYGNEVSFLISCVWLSDGMNNILNLNIFKLLFFIDEK